MWLHRLITKILTLVHRSRMKKMWWKEELFCTSNNRFRWIKLNRRAFKQWSNAFASLTMTVVAIKSWLKMTFSGVIGTPLSRLTLICENKWQAASRMPQRHQRTMVKAIIYKKKPLLGGRFRFFPTNNRIMFPRHWAKTQFQRQRDDVNGMSFYSETNVFWRKSRLNWHGFIENFTETIRIVSFISKFYTFFDHQERRSISSLGICVSRSI